MEFSRLILSQRVAAGHATAKSFFKSVDLGCSYYYYSRIEGGKELPRIELVDRIITALRLDKRAALYAWVRDQMLDDQARELFRDFADLPAGTRPEDLFAGETLILNRVQAEFLKNDTSYMEIIIFVHVHGESGVSSAQVAEAFAMPVDEAATLMKQMADLGLFKYETSIYKAYANTFIPQSNDFAFLRRAQFARAFAQYQRADVENQLGHVATVKLTPQQFLLASERIVSVTNWLFRLAKSATSEAKASPHTFGFFGSKRSLGENND